MEEKPKKKGMGALDKHKKVPSKIIKEDEPVKKTNWGKLIKAVYKIIEPELKKLPKVYILIPVGVITFELAGIYKAIELIILIFTK